MAKTRCGSNARKRGIGARRMDSECAPRTNESTQPDRRKRPTGTDNLPGWRRGQGKLAVLLGFQLNSKPLATSSGRRG